MQEQFNKELKLIDDHPDHFIGPKMFFDWPASTAG